MTSEDYISSTSSLSVVYPDLSAYRDYVQPMFSQDGDVLLQVECGGKEGLLYLSKLCQGSKGPCIHYENMWLTPNEFQYICGRETAKDWKRSIRHYGKSMKMLLSKGVIAVHPSVCVCDGCSTHLPVNRLRLSGKVRQDLIRAENADSSCCGLGGFDSECNNYDIGYGIDEGLRDSCCLPVCQGSGYPLNHSNRPLLQIMDSIKKTTPPIYNSVALEPKKESRLTSIIDQLLINKTKDVPATNDDKPDHYHLMDNGSDPLDSDICNKRGESDGPEGRDGPVTAKHPGGQQPLVSGVTSEAARAAVSSSENMPTDTLAIKPERFSPDVDSSSPSVSPHSPSPARPFPGFGLRPQGSAGLERFSPAALTGSAPALKQMEMMTRNYSDFMRSLAAKYNNQGPPDSLPFGQTNGLMRGLESMYPFKTSSTPPLLGRTAEADNGRKSDGSPPILLDSRFPPYNLSDFSSSQTLLNLVRTASAQSASQLENYLRGAAKRSLDGETTRGDPLDLSSKRMRTDSPSPHGSGRGIHSPRDLREMVQNSLKLEAEILGSSDLNAALRLSAKKSHALSSLLDSRLAQKIDFPIGGRLSSSRTSNNNNEQPKPCPSLCAEQSCSSKSEASEVAQWTVDQVVEFVASLDCCSEYTDKFREQSIDGASLSLLSEEHLTTFLGMKLGPALRLRSALAKRIGHCALCMHCIHCHKSGGEPDPSSPTLNK